MPGLSMTTIAFDTHKLVRTLKDVGIQENQAETIVEVIWTSRADVDVAIKDGCSHA